MAAPTAGPDDDEDEEDDVHEVSLREVPEQMVLTAERRLATPLDGARVGAAE